MTNTDGYGKEGMIRKYCLGESDSFCLGEFCYLLVAAEVILSVCRMMLITHIFQPGTSNTWADINCSQSLR